MRIFIVFVSVLLLLILLLPSSAQDDLTPTRTPYPTPLPSITPMATLPRNPTGEQLYSYFLYHTVGRSITDREHQPSPQWVIHAQQLFHDLNGDGEDDLILLNTDDVAVLLWQGNEYNEPFVLQYYAGRLPYARVLYEDWTGDSIPELIYDTYSPYVGTNLGGGEKIRSVIHCGEISCNLVWEGYLNDTHYSGSTFTFYNSTVEVQLGSSLIYTTTGFTLANIGINVPEKYFLRHTTTEAHFEWNGSFFAQLEVIETAPGEPLEQTTYLKATHEQQEAEINVIYVENPDPFAYGEIIQCQLLINEVEIGEAFNCDDYFTSLDWRDVSNDGIPELLVETVTAISGIDEAERRCYQRYLIIYQFENDTYEQIASVGGCFVSADLIGVQIDDIDEDGQVEILASPSVVQTIPDTGCPVMEGTPIIPGIARCWTELNNSLEVYRWNGERFVLSETISREQE